MPLYEYECQACQHRFEVIQKFSDPLVEICPVCGGVVRKLMSSPAIQFKGSGWYITDYAKKDGPSAVKTDATSSPAASDQTDRSNTKADASKEKDSGDAGKTASEKDAAPKAAAPSTPSPAPSDSTPKAAKAHD